MCGNLSEGFCFTWTQPLLIIGCTLGGLVGSLALFFHVAADGFECNERKMCRRSCCRGWLSEDRNVWRESYEETIFKHQIWRHPREAFPFSFSVFFFFYGCAMRCGIQGCGSGIRDPHLGIKTWTFEVAPKQESGYSGSDQEKCSEKNWDQIPCYCCLPSIEPEGSISSASITTVHICCKRPKLINFEQKRQLRSSYHLPPIEVLKCRKLSSFL